MSYFGCVHIILRSPFVPAPNNIIHKHLDDILADYKSHLVLEEYQSMSSIIQWSYVDGYMTWFYNVLHQVMTSNTPGHPPMPTNEEIRMNGQARDGHVIALLICQNILWITYEDIEFELFERDGNDVVFLARSIITNAHNALGYR